MFSIIDKRKGKILFLGVIINILIFLLIFKIYGLALGNLENVILYRFGYFDFENLDIIVAIVMFMINPILVLIATGEEVQINLKIFGPYIFTRGKSRSSFLLSKAFEILCYITIFLLVQITITAICSLLAGFRIHSTSEFVKIIGYSVILNLIVYFINVLISNIATMIIEYKYVLLIILGYQIAILSMLKSTTLIKSMVIKYIPFINSIFGWYEDRLIQEQFENIYRIKVDAFTVGSGVIVNILIAILVVFIGIKIIEKKDIK